MTFEAFQELVKEEALKAGLQEYELYYTEEENTQSKGINQEISSFSSDMECGVGFRCILNGKTGYSATEWFTPEQAHELVRIAMENAQTLETEEETKIYGPCDHYQEVESSELPAIDLQEAALKIQREAKETDARVQGGSMSTVAHVRGKVRIINSKGLDLQHEYEEQVAGIMAVVKEGDTQYSGSQYEAKPFHPDVFRTLARKAVENAVAKIGAGSVPTGIYDVILDADAMGSILEAYVPIFDAGQAQKGMSLLGGQEGQPIAASCVTVMDDPFYKDSMVAIPFDAEGTATYTKAVIREGVLETLLYNHKTADKAGVNTTGNASKAGYAGTVETSPYTFYVKPGEKSLAEMMKAVEQGVYVTSVTGLHAGTNAITGDFSIQCGGFMIRNGVKAEAVTSFTISGNFFDMLKQVKEIGSDLQFQLPSGFTMIGAPSVWVGKLSVAGE
ncbi:MAG TPA: TldD/PmbA family protein [Candidatus Faecimorpha stercoravium]|nr:TldD/PmbA family protein [Candidatus Faecimorpha stercoravium]